MSFPARDTTIIRDLARRVAEIAADPGHEEKKQLWMCLNRLQRVRPTIHVQAIAANLWEELIPPGTLQCGDAFCRAQEAMLRRKIYGWENFRDDRVVDNVVPCPITVTGDVRYNEFGMRPDLEQPDVPSGAYAMKNVFETERDIDRIDTDPKLVVDWDATEKRYQRLGELYAGILQVEKRGLDFFWLVVMDKFIKWRGIEQMYVDLLERPAWVHEALERITTAHLRTIEQYEDLGLLSPGNGNTILGSGGHAWTDQLPQPDFDGEHVRLKDIWARCATQIFTNVVSPEMHEEFAIRYESRLLERFGLACYGCCEPLDRKMHVVRQIKNLRRVSMSPWVDLDRAAAEVGTDYVYTHKPNPTIVSMEAWHPDLARAQLRDAFEKTRNNIVEVNLQDLHTVRNEPHRLTEWTRIALELAEEYA